MLLSSRFILIFVALILLISSSVSACTGFTATKNGTTLVGNNNDWYDPDIYVKIHPPKDEKYGTFIIESKYALPWDPNHINKCGGINDQGLFYEKFNNYPLKFPIKSIYKRFFRPVLELENYCLEHCATVKEVVEIYSKYNLFFMFPYQSFFVDKNGNSVIIEGDELIYKNGDYQVVTNFLQSQTDSNKIDCKRYLKAVDMLKNMESLSVKYFTSICNSTCIDTLGCCTQDSQVYNLTSGEIFFYFHHIFDNYIKFNLTEEIKKGEQIYYIPSIFEPLNNNPPFQPKKPNIFKTGLLKRKYRFTTNTSDINDDKLYYKWDFGDGIVSRWEGPYNSSQIAMNMNIHTYKKFGNYKIKVKAKDIYDNESDWSNPLNVEISFLKIFENIPQIFTILQKKF